MAKFTRILALLLPFGLAACGPDFVPRDKVAEVDMRTGEVILPHPCPDWSHSAQINWDNSNHSNFGCAVNNNLAVQLEDPRDLRRGKAGPPSDPEFNQRVIERYRAGEIPEPLTPIQGEGAAE